MPLRAEQLFSVEPALSQGGRVVRGLEGAVTGIMGDQIGTAPRYGIKLAVTHIAVQAPVTVSRIPKH